MRFSKALKKLRKGEKVTRNEWPDGCYLRIENDEENWSLYHPTIYFEPADENQSHGIWTPHQADILANDWHVYSLVHVTFKKTEATVDVLKAVQDTLKKEYQDAYDALNLEGDK